MTTSNDYPATEIAKLLLEVVDENVTALKRNDQSSKQIISKARAIYDEIGKLITAIETEAKLNWSNFTKYTEAIEPLERLLLDFALIADPIAKHLPPNDNTADCVQFISRWAGERNMIIEALDGLSSKKFQALSDTFGTSLQSDVINARYTDDLSALEALHSGFQVSATPDEAAFQPGTLELVSDVRYKVDAAILAFKANKTYNLRLAGIAVQSMMAVFALFAFLRNSETPEELRTYLSSYTIWSQAGSLLAKILLHLSSKDDIISPELTTSYNNFEKCLLGVGGFDLDYDLLKLTRLAGRIRRPFHGRSVALVAIWYELVGKDTPMDPKELIAAMSEAITALTKASRSVTDISAFLHGNPVIRQVEDAFMSATGRARKCFPTNGSEWSEHEAVFNNAVKTDRRHLEDLQKRLKPARGSDEDGGDKEDVSNKENGGDHGNSIEQQEDGRGEEGSSEDEIEEDESEEGHDLWRLFD